MGKTVYEQLKEIADYYGKKERINTLEDAGYSIAFACRRICLDDDTSASEPIPTTVDLEQLINCVVEAAILIDQPQKVSRNITSSQRQSEMK